MNLQSNLKYMLLPKKIMDTFLRKVFLQQCDSNLGGHMLCSAFIGSIHFLQRSLTTSTHLSIVKVVKTH